MCMYIYIYVYTCLGQYPDLEELVSVTLVEASNHILGTFDQRLVQYTSKELNNKRVGGCVDRCVGGGGAYADGL